MNGGPEQVRIDDMRAHKAHWNRWGPYLSQRAWGTVREDYSPDGDAWAYFTHEQARARAYRWNEDGLLGICDRHQLICFAPLLWNGRDPFLKERLFGLTNDQGNHGEDVKEAYFYLDNTPSHSYQKALYKYPQCEFPYRQLIEENRRRTRVDPEYKLVDTGVFAEDRYFDVFIEYAKAAPDDVLIRITAANRGPEAAELHVLPAIWFRNTWSWGYPVEMPFLRQGKAPGSIGLHEPYYGRRWLYAKDAGELLFTENNSNQQLLWGKPNDTPFVKDGINARVVERQGDAVNPDLGGTKAAAHYRFQLQPGEQAIVELRLTDAEMADPFGPDYAQTFADRIREADAFYAYVAPRGLSEDGRLVMRQAFAGLLWSKQFYHYVVREWLKGDPAFPPPAAERFLGRNHEWIHLYKSDVISMPDKWEYPWYAAWVLAFHCLPLALVDPVFA